MFTVTKRFSADYRVKGSKFLGYLCPSSNTEEVESNIDLVKDEHPTATHHCYAYRLNPNESVEFSTDDGEPSGTAGLPILNTLKSYMLMNVLLVVVRYYGGTKLGRAGLIDAYQTAAQKTIESAGLRKLVPIKTYRIQYDYSQQSVVDKLKNDFGWIELESSYLESVELTLGCPEAQSSRFKENLESLRHLFENVEFVGDSYHVEV